uniref:RNase H type-1 domain-containing protein n=1 Tax=Oryza sativa subsp. japonica TaxID=39947 RepID=Q6F2Q8_ORYSJ|nr:hypothetical protein [Oryza sativa Japonica Group]
MATPNNNVVAAMSGTKGGSGTPCSSDVAASPLVEEAAASAEMTAEAAAGGWRAALGSGCQQWVLGRSRTSKGVLGRSSSGLEGLTTSALGWGGCDFWREKLRGGNAAAAIEQRDQRAATGGGKTTAFYINMDIEIRTNPNTLIRDAIVKQPVSGQFFEIALGKPSLHPAIQWTSLPIVVETDCLIVLHLLDSKEKDRSMFASIIQEAKALVVGGGREIVIRKIVCGFIDPK